MKNRYYKLISALIAIAMLVCSIPMSATASDISLDAGVTEAFKPVYNDSALKKELREKKGLGVVEIESLRSEYAKHYQISVPLANLFIVKVQMESGSILITDFIKMTINIAHRTDGFPFQVIYPTGEYIRSMTVRIPFRLATLHQLQPKRMY